MANHDFLVKRDDLTVNQLAQGEQLNPDAGQVVMTLERFALTANNITYGVAGDMIGYWQFFPAPQGWGRIPVWGIARVSNSNHPDFQNGERYYGYFPMSSELLVQPVKVTAQGFIDGVEHRAALPIVYNQYVKVSVETGFDPAFDNHKMLYRPLFTTSYVLDDYFLDNDDFGAKAIVLGSASSKTAFGLAFMLKQSKRVHIIGLTSQRNKSFVEGLGLYDQVLTYDEVQAIDATVATGYVDMSGNREVLSKIHHHLQDNLVASCGVGITHWESRDGKPPAELPGAKPTMFFAPTQIVKRHKELGAAEYQSRLTTATDAFVAKVDEWVTIEETNFTDIAAAYDEVLNGAPADKGVVVVL